MNIVLYDSIIVVMVLQEKSYVVWYRPLIMCWYNVERRMLHQLSLIVLFHTFLSEKSENLWK